MPQVWMTYPELAAFLGCSIASAELHVNQIGLDHRKSRDGQIRVKLSPALTQTFFSRIREDVHTEHLTAG